MGNAWFGHCKDRFRRLTSAGQLYSLSIISLCLSDIPEQRWVDMINTECDRRQRHREKPIMCLSPQPLNGGQSGCIGGTFGRSKSELSLDASTAVGVEGSGISSAQTQSVHAQPQPVDSQSSQSLQMVLMDESQSQSVRSSFSRQSSRVTWNTCKDALESCHRQFLIKRVHELEGKCIEYQKALKKAKRENKILMKKQDKQKCRELVPHEPTDLEITKGKVRLTKRGFVNMGIRKALALTSAVGFPLVTLTETSRQTVA